MAKARELFAAKDLTQGPPWKRILEFSIPMLIGNIAQQLYNTADSIIVGRYIGDNALAAVGSAAPVLHLLLVLFVGISVGAGIMVAQYFGARDRENLSKTIGNCLTLTAITSVIIMVVGPLVTRPLLELLNTPASIIDWCVGYLNIFFLGGAGFSYFNILSGILRGLGDSVSALVFLLLSTALNVVLDIIFVASFGLGVPGVALATVLAQALSAVLCLGKLARMREHFDLNRAALKLDRELSLAVIKLGLPSGLTQAIFSMAMIMVQSLMNTFGEMVIAANVIVMRVLPTFPQSRRDAPRDRGALPSPCRTAPEPPPRRTSPHAQSPPLNRRPGNPGACFFAVCPAHRAKPAAGNRAPPGRAETVCGA